MQERIVITGLGVVSAAGITRDAFFAALATGASGIRPHPRPDEGISLSATLDDFGARRLLDPRSLRRLARLSQLSLVAAKEALAQAALGDAVAPERTGIVLGTGLGTLRETMDFMRSYVAGGPETASPLLFPSSVMNAAAGQMAIELGLRGVNTTLNHREGSPFDALMLACDLLALGRADALLVGAVDEISDMMLLGYQRLGRLSKTGVRPSARDRDGTVLGEGAAVLLLERERDAERRGAMVLARVAGFAASGESRPRVGFGHHAEGLASIMRAALDDAAILPAAIDYVAGAGCGLASDALEARALSSVFERAVPCGSIAGQTGDFMSAGVLRMAAALYAFERQSLPGTVGAGEPDPEAPMPGLVLTARSAEVNAVLLPSLSQGGANAAVVLTRA